MLHKFNRKEKVNVVLSGGGVRGAGHIAYLEKLEELDIQINALSGSSAGALVGALYASGMRPGAILEFFKATPIFRYTWLNPLKAGIFDSSKYEEVIESFVKHSFETLELPLTIVATNIERGASVYFNEGHLIKPLLASCAVPAVFTPVEVNGELYSDGGIMDNFPILPFVHSELPLLGSYVFEPAIKTKEDLSSILKVSNHANNLLLHAANQYKFEQTDHTVIFPLGQFGTFETKRIDEIYAVSKAFLDNHLG